VTQLRSLTTAPFSDGEDVRDAHDRALLALTNLTHLDGSLPLSGLPTATPAAGSDAADAAEAASTGPFAHLRSLRCCITEVLNELAIPLVRRLQLLELTPAFSMQPLAPVQPSESALAALAAVSELRLTGTASYLLPLVSACARVSELKLYLPGEQPDATLRLLAGCPLLHTIRVGSGEYPWAMLGAWACEAADTPRRLVLPAFVSMDSARARVADLARLSPTASARARLELPEPPKTLDVKVRSSVRDACGSCAQLVSSRPSCGASCLRFCMLATAPDAAPRKLRVGLWRSHHTRRTGCVADLGDRFLAAHGRLGF
jgi:hypothetical protein